MNYLKRMQIYDWILINLVSTGLSVSPCGLPQWVDVAKWANRCLLSSCPSHSSLFLVGVRRKLVSWPFFCPWYLQAELFVVWWLTAESSVSCCHTEGEKMESSCSAEAAFDWAMRLNKSVESESVKEGRSCSDERKCQLTVVSSGFSPASLFFLFLTLFLQLVNRRLLR